MEYAVQFWSHYLRKDIEVIERVQYSATKMVGFENLSYSNRLKELNICTLEARRNRGDLVQLIKIIKSLDTGDSFFFIVMAEPEAIVSN